MKTLVKEYLRPWKLFSLACGIGLLIAGAKYYHAPDWDVPISFIMAIATYLTAGWSMRVVLDRRWKMLPLAALYAYVSVDGLYALYWHFTDPQALEFMRWANLQASFVLYAVCGLIWLHNGTLKELFHEATAIRPGNVSSKTKST